MIPGPLPLPERMTQWLHGVMTATIHTCPACQLRFAFMGEMIDHIRSDHRPDDDSHAPATPWGMVTVPIDPAGDNSIVIDIASALARQAGMALSLVATPGGGVDARGTEAVLREQARTAREAGIEATTWHMLADAEPADAIIDVASDGDTTLLCMATHARGAVGEAVLGSVSSEVLRRSPVPVLLIGPNTKVQEDPFTHLLIALDGSEEAERALQVATAIAPLLNTSMVLIEVLDPELQLPADVTESALLRRAASGLPASRTDWEVLHDTDAGRAIVGAAVSLPNAMIVMGTHGRTGLRRLAAGSVARDVVRHSMLPVLVVGPTRT